MQRIPYAESLRLLREQCEKLRSATERLPVRDAAHRVLREPIYARRSNPAEPLSAMDGIAIDFQSARELPVTLQPGQWIRINTGEPVPSDRNAVVKIEDVRWEGEAPVLEKPVQFYQNIRAAAEDFSADDLLLSAGHKL